MWYYDIVEKVEEKVEEARVEEGAAVSNGGLSLL